MDQRLFKEQVKSLAPREAEVMRLVANGMGNAAIASEIGIARKTVENTIVRAKKKFTPSLSRAEFIQHWWRIIGA